MNYIAVELISENGKTLINGVMDVTKKNIQDAMEINKEGKQF